MQLDKGLAVLIYILILVAIGLIANKNKALSASSSSYLLGDRSLGPWVSAISANASDMSIWLFMGLPMAVYEEGIIYAWSAIGLIFFMFFNWQLVAAKLRNQTEQLNALTIFEFFNKKTMGGKSRYLLNTSSVISLLFLTIYVAAGISGMGYLVELLFGFSYATGCILSIVAILAYVFIGGFTAICYTDFAQGLFLLLVITLVPITALTSLSLDNSFSESLAFISKLQGFWPQNISETTLALGLFFGWGIGYFGQPHILNKFMATKDFRQIRKAKWVSFCWQSMALGGAIFSGLVAKEFFLTSSLPNSQLLFAQMCQNLFPVFLSSFILCAILAATLSTADSQIIVLASVLGNDLLPSLKKNPSDKQILWVSRASSIATCLVAMFVALLKPSNTSIHSLVYYCWAGLGCSFGPLMFFCLYKKSLHKISAWFGMVTGCLVAVFWIYLNIPVLALIPGFLASALAIAATEFVLSFKNRT